eukprot:CAMPEP_0114253244 /NCGR_PEP_ID=MMETSP0058-20121206/16282_1 /TAXON_ID=36894 /ORGANISM="Pyramimonas parkeae, CCMP726" /LENGTH=76 /DNA_ID=CAMNT_0001367263 /DNA_START=107 /DNA_END=337 /DNA_ORIENTATION=-
MAATKTEAWQLLLQASVGLAGGLVVAKSMGVYPFNTTETATPESQSSDSLLKALEKEKSTTSFTYWGQDDTSKSKS